MMSPEQRKRSVTLAHRPESEAGTADSDRKPRPEGAKGDSVRHVSMAQHRVPEVRKAVTVRRARTSDVPAVRRLLDRTSASGILLDKATVTLYEDIQEFWVAERDEDAEVVGCGALHVMWEDLAEVRTLAVDPALRGAGVGHQLLEKLLQTARWLGVRRVFCLTFEVDFFAKHGFVEIGETPVDSDVYSGAAAFL